LSVLAKDLHITGELRSDGEVQVDGVVNGQISASQITIGPTGTVIGALNAAEISIAGAVHGSVRGRAVSLGSTARVHAEVACESLNLDKGAVLEARPPAAEQPTGR
jgi:cytoskeletal protein CcmA (bactofilin family)